MTTLREAGSQSATGFDPCAVRHQPPGRLRWDVGPDGFTILAEHAVEAA